MEIAKELGLIKGGKDGGGGGGGGNCGGGGSMCGKSLSEVSMNGGGATTSNFPTGPVFSVGQAAPPGEIHPVSCSVRFPDGLGLVLVHQVAKQVLFSTFSF